jgi:DMSO/TMAO reductase YedYZ heme-binding membrane subunit
VAIALAVQRFMLFYSGVFALIALTAAVGAGLIAADELVMRPGGRVLSQMAHRALSLTALGFLAVHIALEVLAHRSHAVDAVIPFLARGRTLYIGIGTLAADLTVLIIATGVARKKFVGRWPGAWRAIHVCAYLAWPLAILHGLLGGRTAKPYVDWSYGGCVAAVVLALVVRFAAAKRRREELAPHPVPARSNFATPQELAALLPRQISPEYRGDLRPAPPLRALPGDRPDRAAGGGSPW